MGSDVPHLRYLFTRKDYMQYRSAMKTFESSLAFDISDVARFRLHVLEYFEKYGLRPTMEAFNVRKSTLYDWRRTLAASKGKLVSLVPHSTRPHHTRTMQTDVRLVRFITEMRREYGNVGANIIKPFLDVYADELGISTLARATIEKVIQRHHLQFQQRVRYQRKRKNKRLRIKKSPKIVKPGYLQMDSITLYINKERHLFMCVIDVYTKLALTRRVESLSSLHAKQVLEKFRQQCPYVVHAVQTDNGSEFLGVFDDDLEHQKIPHHFIYPRSPKINGCVERFNRTIQEEFIKRNDEIYYDLNAFQGKLDSYLDWYNTKRPHSTLHYLSPAQFINTLIPKSM